MDVLDAFVSTWSAARHTFGQGVPPTGEQFDRSAALRRMQATVESAAPGSRWSGTAAASYETTNADHAKVLAQLASLDTLLNGHVTASSRVVSAGREDLEAVHQWVLDAAASVPPGENSERMLLSIVQWGLRQLREIITTSNGDLVAIGEQMRSLAAEYDALASGGSDR